MNKRNFLLFLIVALGFLLRVRYIDKIPPGVNRDEASIGYTAYSLLKTGRDEYGTSLPMSFKSFGDWKLPFYIYADIPFVKIFGLTDLAVRLPSVLFGTFTIIIVYFLSKILFTDFKIPILSAYLFSILPWSIHLSRNASEANTAVFFTTFGVLLFLLSEKKRWTMLLGTVFLAVSLYIYHANHIFTLLLFIGLGINYWRQHKNSPAYWLSVLTFAALSIFIYSQTLLVADKTKISGLFALSDPVLVYQNITIDRVQRGNSPVFVANIFHNKLSYTLEYTLQNYLRSFSPEFLFITAGGNSQHNIPDFGNLYLWAAPFLLLGMTYLLAGKNRYKGLLLFWFLTSPIAASITKDAPHTARMSGILPLMAILAAYGFMHGIRYINSTKSRIFSIMLLSLLAFILILNFAVWNNRYFIYFPIKRASVWGGGYANLISLLKGSRNFDAQEIVMSRPEYSPYIYFLFYQGVDPAYFQKSAVRYPVTDEGFQHVEKFGNYSFRRIDWADDLAIPNRLYIDWADQVPAAATDSAVLITEKLIKKLSLNHKDTADLKTGDLIIGRKAGEIKLLNGESMFILVKTEKSK